MLVLEHPTACVGICADHGDAAQAWPVDPKGESQVRGVRRDQAKLLSSGDPELNQKEQNMNSVKTAVNNFFSKKRNKALVIVLVLGVLGAILLAFQTSSPSERHQSAPIVDGRSKQDRRTKGAHRPVSRLRKYGASKNASTQASPCGEDFARDQRSTQSSPAPFYGDEQ